VQARRDPGDGADDREQRSDGVQDFGHWSRARSGQRWARAAVGAAHGACRGTRHASSASDRTSASCDYADFFADVFFVDFFADFFFVADFFGADFLADDFFADDRFGVDFFDADFFEADFFDADFFEADFFDADFFEADFFDTDVFDADFFDADFFDADFFDADFFDADFFGGTLAPARRASDRPIAIACFRLLTFLPEPPLRNVPSLRSCMTFLTFACAFFPYFAMSLLRWTGTSRDILHQRRDRVTSNDLPDRGSP
jgi:hypothetical protein